MLVSRNEKVRPSSPVLSLPPNFNTNSGAHPSESMFNHVSPSILAAAAASASQAGIPPQSLPFLSSQDIPLTSVSHTKDNDGDQGETDKDTKLKEILSHIYQYVSRQYNQRLNEQRETSKGGSPNGITTKVSNFGIKFNQHVNIEVFFVYFLSFNLEFKNNKSNINYIL